MKSLARHPLDLNQISADDLAAWLDHNRCQYTPDSRQLAWYVRAYRVADKIKRAKRSGTWQRIVDAKADERRASAANLAAALEAIRTTPAIDNIQRLKLVPPAQTHRPAPETPAEN